MLPGPNQIIACPHCGAFAYYGTLMSGNTFGAILYSDGKCVAPHMPEPPPFVECHSCHGTYWLEAAEEIGTVPWHRSSDDDVNPAWAEAPVVQPPSEAKFYEVIDRVEKDGTPNELRRLRILAWHKRNDSYRDADIAPVEMTPAARKNMQSLSLEIGEGGKKGQQVSLSDGLTVTELLREQGYFDAALKMLEGNVWHDLQPFADQIMAQCRKKNDRVVRLS